jgi:prepilin-type N-terminal cleavage/methylation domain-containing protein
MRITTHPHRKARGFTLIEVVLAIVIAVGLLTGVLVFYRQAAIVREEILRKADALSAVRLVMDRISTELRTVPPNTAGVAILSGDSRSLRILHTSVPSKTPWRGGNLGRASIAEADWVEVAYRWSSDTNQPGLFRQERAHTTSAPVSTNLLTEVEPITGSGTNSIVPSGGTPLSESIAYLRFRYWDGSRWQNAWEKPEPPTAVEVSLGLDPMEEDALSDSTGTEEPAPYPYEVFRRIIALPAALGTATAPSDPNLTDDTLTNEVPTP